MKAAAFHAAHRPLEVTEIPPPEPSPGQVLVKVAACGLCHTDLHFIDHDTPTFKTPPLVLGHEISGTIAGLGAGVTGWKEGDTVTLNVSNALDDDTSIHWHGILLPANMDGVPGLSFHGIRPGETYNYRFRVKQSGTYWYHSHSGFQEQRGL